MKDDIYALKINDLTKKYNNYTALKALSFTVNHGEFVGISGFNGSGKSTLLKIIVTLVQKTTGKVFVHGLDLDTHASSIKKLLGYVPQDFNFSIAEPVWQILLNQGGYHGLDTSIIKSSAEFYLNALDLWDKRKIAAGLLSGGMKRKLMLARALITNPKLLILDEPTVGVDSKSRHIIWNILKQLNNNGTTIILVTHFPDEINMLCKTIISFKTEGIKINKYQKDNNT